jgi:hypothetical protein
MPTNITVNETGAGAERNFDAYANIVLRDRPLGYWRLDDPSGTSALDYTGYGDNGTLSGTITLTQAGIPGGRGGMLFNGSSGQIQIPTNAAWPNGNGSWTIEAWCKPTNSTNSANGHLVTIGNPGTNAQAGFIAQNATGGWNIGTWGGFGHDFTGNGTSTAGTLYHLVGTYDGTHLTLYVNDVTYGPFSPSSLNLIPTNQYIGSAHNSFYFAGMIAEVAVYATALSAAQVAQHYAIGLSTIVLKETGTGSEVVSDTGKLPSDTGTGTEGGTIRATLTVSEAGAGTEAPFAYPSGQPTAREHGSGAETLKLLQQITETGSGAERVASPYARQVLNDGAYFFWRCQETTGTTLHDAGPAATNLTLAGTYEVGTSSPFLTPNTNDASVDFGGAQGSATNATLPSLSNWSALTVEYWVNFVDTSFGSDQSVLGLDDPAGNHRGLNAGVVGGNAGIFIRIANASGTSTSVTFAKALQAHTWYHVVLTWDGLTVVCYLNGIIIGRTMIAGTMQAPTANAMLSEYVGNSGNKIHGQLSNVAVYNKVLSQSQIANHYAIAGYPANIFTALTGSSTFLSTLPAHTFHLLPLNWSNVLYYEMGDGWVSGTTATSVPAASSGQSYTLSGTTSVNYTPGASGAAGIQPTNNATAETTTITLNGLTNQLTGDACFTFDVTSSSPDCYFYLTPSIYVDMQVASNKVVLTIGSNSYTVLSGFSLTSNNNVFAVRMQWITHGGVTQIYCGVTVATNSSTWPGMPNVMAFDALPALTTIAPQVVVQNTSGNHPSWWQATFTGTTNNYYVLGQINGPATVSEAGTSTELISPVIQEQGTSAEQVTIAATATKTDAGTGAEVVRHWVPASPDVYDPGIGSETLAILQKITESGAGSEQLASPYALQVLTDGAQYYYRCNETSGTTLHDLGPHAWNLTTQNSPTLNQSTPILANASNAASVLFNGSNQSAVKNSANPPGFSNWATLTMESWFKLSGSPSGNVAIASWGSASNNQGFLWGVLSGATGIWLDLAYASGSNLGIGLKCTVSTSAWQHLVLTWDGTTVLGYLNGALVAEGMMVGTLQNPTSSGGVQLGAQGSYAGNFFPGQIGEVAIYHNVLTASQVFNHYVLAGYPSPITTTLTNSSTIKSNVVSGNTYNLWNLSYANVLWYETGDAWNSTFSNTATIPPAPSGQSYTISNGNVQPLATGQLGCPNNLIDVNTTLAINGLNNLLSGDALFTFEFGANSPNTGGNIFFYLTPTIYLEIVPDWNVVYLYVNTAQYLVYTQTGTPWTGNGTNVIAIRLKWVTSGGTTTLSAGVTSNANSSTIPALPTLTQYTVISALTSIIPQIVFAQSVSNDIGSTTHWQSLVTAVSSVSNVAGQINAPIAVSEAGTGSELPGQPVRPSETATGSEAATITLLPKESGTGAETPFLKSRAFTVAESGTGAERIVINNTFKLTESGTGGETLTVLLKALESGSGSEAAKILLKVLEAGAGSEAATILLKILESGTASEREIVSKTFTLAESASGSELAKILLKLAESGAGTESETVSAAIPVHETGTGSEGGTILLKDTESGTASEREIVSKTFTLTETGSGSEVLKIRIPLAETGTGSEALNVNTGAKIITDSGTGSEHGTICLKVAESGSGAEHPIISKTFTLAESGAGAELTERIVTVPDTEPVGHESLHTAVSITVSEAGSGAETVSLTVKVQETGSGADAIKFSSKQAEIPERGTGTEALTVHLTVTPDAGFGTESVTLGTHSGPFAEDTSHGTESATIAFTVLDSSTGDEAVAINEVFDNEFAALLFGAGPLGAIFRNYRVSTAPSIVSSAGLALAYAVAPNVQSGLSLQYSVQASSFAGLPILYTIVPVAQQISINGNTAIPLPEQIQYTLIPTSYADLMGRPVQQGFRSMVWTWTDMTDAEIALIMQLYNPTSPTVTVVYPDETGAWVIRSAELMPPVLGTRATVHSTNVALTFTKIDLGS